MTVTDLLPGVAVPIVGAPGTATGIAAAVVSEAAPVPAALVAATSTVYAVPLVSCVMSRLVAVASAVSVLTGVGSPAKTRTT